MTYIPAKPLVYTLQHERVLNEDETDVKFIGVFTSQAMAEAAVAQLRRVAGFRDFPDGFIINAHELDEHSWQTGLSSTFIPRGQNNSNSLFSPQSDHQPAAWHCEISSHAMDAGVGDRNLSPPALDRCPAE